MVAAGICLLLQQVQQHSRARASTSTRTRVAMRVVVDPTRPECGDRRVVYVDVERFFPAFLLGAAQRPPLLRCPLARGDHRSMLQGGKGRSEAALAAGAAAPWHDDHQ